ncbi:hypothetical protein [Pedobacter jamesrossensis]|uniref:DUF2726 domain-containing protein n=1 Tax=Pedobacter jamesrossensis TaxID=1908238 RepID=A0ABV8NM62_9SPHI
MQKSKGQKVSESKRISLVVMQKLCSEIYKKLYVIKSLSYIPKITGGYKTILNCECKKHKICFSTTMDKFLKANQEENRTSCVFCRYDKRKEKYNIEHYQKLVDENKGKHVALVKRILNNRLTMKCLKHKIEYSQSLNGLKRCGCIKCLHETPRMNSKVDIFQVKNDIIQWGSSIIALKIFGNYNKLTGEVRNVLYKCTKAGHEGDIIKPLNKRLSSNPCVKCAKEAKSITHIQMVEKALVIHPIAYIYGKHREIYTIKDKIHFTCSIPACSRDNVKTFKSHFYKKRGCIYCVRKLNGEKQIKSDEEIYAQLEQFGKKGFKLTGEKDFDNTKKNLLRQFVCEKHNEDFYSYATKSYLKHIGCKICNQKSKMEHFIKGYLEMKKIDFEPQKRFKDCVNINQLPFDFYIPIVPSTKKSMLIEYDGGQHFLPIYGEEMLRQQVKRDFIKTNYADSVGIELIRIPYTLDNEIVSILDAILFNDRNKNKPQKRFIQSTE